MSPSSECTQRRGMREVRQLLQAEEELLEGTEEEETAGSRRHR